VNIKRISLVHGLSYDDLDHGEGSWCDPAERSADDRGVDRVFRSQVSGDEAGHGSIYRRRRIERWASDR
jgi:hypothetical protein